MPEVRSGWVWILQMKLNGKAIAAMTQPRFKASKSEARQLDCTPELEKG